MTGEPIEIEGKDWRAIAVKWLANQGTSTVLLFLILGSLGYGILVLPERIVTQIIAGFQSVQAEQKAVVKEVVTGWDRTQSAHEKQTDRLIEILRGDLSTRRP